MKLNEYQEISKRTMPKMIVGKHEIYYDDGAKSNYAMGLAGECGEVVDLLKKWIHHKHPENREELVKELGDVLHYVAGLCSMYGIRLEEVATTNIMKLQERYPQGFTSQGSINRREKMNEEHLKITLSKILEKDVCKIEKMAFIEIMEELVEVIERNQSK
jgi:NTP pyrophosphatase (non-canonical NTP hydrolase)